MNSTKCCLRNRWQTSNKRPRGDMKETKGGLSSSHDAHNKCIKDGGNAHFPCTQYYVEGILRRNKYGIHSCSLCLAPAARILNLNRIGTVFARLFFTLRCITSWRSDPDLPRWKWDCNPKEPKFLVFINC